MHLVLSVILRLWKFYASRWSPVNDEFGVILDYFCSFYYTLRFLRFVLPAVLFETVHLHLLLSLFVLSWFALSVSSCKLLQNVLCFRMYYSFLVLHRTYGHLSWGDYFALRTNQKVLFRCFFVSTTFQILYCISFLISVFGINSSLYVSPYVYGPIRSMKSSR